MLVASCARGEWDGRGDARAETRFQFRMGITSVVPWLVVSESRSPAATPQPPRECCSFVRAEAKHRRSGLPDLPTSRSQVVGTHACCVSVARRREFVAENKGGSPDAERGGPRSCLGRSSRIPPKQDRRLGSGSGRMRLVDDTACFPRCWPSVAPRSIMLSISNRLAAPDCAALAGQGTHADRAFANP